MGRQLPQLLADAAGAAWGKRLPHFGPPSRRWGDTGAGSWGGWGGGGLRAGLGEMSKAQYHPGDVCVCVYKNLCPPGLGWERVWGGQGMGQGRGWAEGECRCL